MRSPGSRTVATSSADNHCENRSRRIPEFRTVQEEAEFWDTHSTAEFEDEWEPTDLEFAPDWRSVRLMSVKLEYSLYNQLRARAEEQGVTAEELAESWLERMLAPSSEASPNSSSTGPKDGER